jgi:enoyl-[acyl-carrier protein] reductase III
MQPEFNEKTILITGGTKGLGLATARAFATRGARKLLLTYRSDLVSASAARESILALGSDCVVIPADLSEEGASETLFTEVVKHTSQLDVYVHNAAATAFKNLLELKSHQIDKTLNITFKSFILNVQKIVPLMKEGGAIVTVSGMDTLRAVPKHGLLGAAKSSLETLTAYFAHELAPRKIRVNGVNPGFFETEGTRKYLGPAFDTVQRTLTASSPLQRTPTLQEFANVILFLSSAQASWVVGQTWVVDGGFDFSLFPDPH